jgi:uncharacterized membrane protein
MQTFFLVAVSIFAINFAALPALATFEDLGTLPGGDYFVSQALGVSGDGTVVVGSGSIVTIVPGIGVIVDEQAIRWEAGVLTSAKPLFTNHERSIAVAASYDGSVITGVVYRSSPWQGGFVWDAGSLTSLGDLPGGSTWSAGRSISDDGSVIAGSSVDGITDRAIRWDLGTMSNLGTGTGWSYAFGVSGDGVTTVGRQENEGAKRWDDLVMSDLASPPGDFGTVAWGISASGNVIVGRSRQSSGDVAVLWDQGVPALLGVLPGDLTSIAQDASGDGQVVVGDSRDSEGFRQAFIWDQGNGMRALLDVLIDQGENMTGWTLREAKSISDDGTVIVGMGVNPDGRSRGWVATIPEPTPTPTVTPTATPTPFCTPTDASCQNNADCCSNQCSGPGGNKVCQPGPTASPTTTPSATPTSTPTPSATPTPTPAPEPRALTALGSGIAMLALLYRRRR